MFCPDVAAFGTARNRVLLPPFAIRLPTFFACAIFTFPVALWNRLAPALKRLVCPLCSMCVRDVFFDAMAFECAEAFGETRHTCAFVRTTDFLNTIAAPLSCLDTIHALGSCCGQC